MKKFFLSFLTFILLLCSLPPQRIFANEPDLPVQSAIAVEADTGKILYEKDSDKKREVGGLSTLLTTYLIFEAIHDKKLSLKDPIKLSEEALALNDIKGAGILPIEANQYTVDQLLTALLVGNSSTAAFALAEKVGGSEKSFVEKMKQKLSEWGIQSPHLINATGLNTQTISGDPDGKEDENQLSAYDIAVIAKHLLQDFPEVTKYTSKPTALFSNTQIENPNLMLEGMPNYRSGVDGLRVSNSTKGGITFAASTTQNGIHMITVVLGVEAVDGDPYARFVATSSLMNYVVRTFVSSIVVKRGDTYGKSKVAITDGKFEFVSAVAKKDFYVVVKQGNQTEPKIQFKSSQNQFKAPVKSGDDVGILQYSDPNKIGRGYLEDQEPTVDMVAGRTIEKSFFLKVWWNEFVRYVNEKL
ncbi:serine hydrolase [Streptococcus parasanguinis]|uniref:serine hydrolase n=1 Tax=Streptococcus parasanguinis TaxID=1318 RepID=UPI001D07F37B|nr:serine hydrolase [Streptococcus parasanguinis]MCB6703948.1 D-alanyl-D-alanine carboxypeptidase [Streptococcus parasanguinis]MCB6738547.1 D-alanyl-D-alanine carboxypeptidase [Streptococcus parasanguinis]MCB7322756.1 D-alanyl-D-alanine carboxypeptidase [Streptococcus parasanguinis]MCB7402263.1 D-alanyl-D-alanine carboxypeptidase [Streptococcus parasanguinis]